MSQSVKAVDRELAYLKSITLGNMFKLERKIGSGSFGSIYEGRCINDARKDVAVKVEALHARHPQLQYEHRVYQTIGSSYGFPAVYWFGQDPRSEFNFLVMDLLGPSLEELFTYCKRKLSLKTVLLLADQMV